MFLDSTSILYHYPRTTKNYTNSKKSIKKSARGNPILSHEIGDARMVWFPGRSRLWTSYAPWREYYNSRNIAYAGWHLYPRRGTKKFVLKHLARHAGAVMLFSSRKTACIGKMMQGFWDGYRAKLGIRFRPNG